MLLRQWRHLIPFGIFKVSKYIYPRERTLLARSLETKRHDGGFGKRDAEECVDLLVAGIDEEAADSTEAALYHDRIVGVLCTVPGRQKYKRCQDDDCDGHNSCHGARKIRGCQEAADGSGERI